jgi:hypothetical protein
MARLKTLSKLFWKDKRVKKKIKTFSRMTANRYGERGTGRRIIPINKRSAISE